MIQGNLTRRTVVAALTAVTAIAGLTADTASARHKKRRLGPAVRAVSHGLGGG